jgi:hypothetical protein
MAISVGSVSTSTTFGASNASSIVAAPSGITAGDLILVIGFINQTTGVTGPSGFTALSSATPYVGSTGRETYFWWKRATGPESGSYTISFTSKTYPQAATAIRFVGCPTTGGESFLDTRGVGEQQTSSTTSASTTVTTSVGSTILLRALNHSLDSNDTAPSGFTEFYQGRQGAVSYSTDLKAAGTHTIPGSTLTVSNNSSVWVGAFKSDPSVFFPFTA